jgi:hypothetical protein
MTNRSVINLVRLNCFECDKLQGGTIAKSITGHSSLQEIILSNCERVNDQDVIALATYCPKLSNLFLNSCLDITDEGMIELAEKCTTRLEVIGLPKKIGDNAIGTILVIRSCGYCISDYNLQYNLIL